MHYAATYNSNEAIIEYLLKAGANPNISNRNGETPLSMALENRQSQAIIRILTEASNENIKLESQKRDDVVGIEKRRNDAEIEKANSSKNDENKTKDEYRKYTADQIYKAEEKLINYLNSSDKSLNPLLDKILRSGKDAWILYKTKESAHKILFNQIRECEAFLKEYGEYTTSTFKNGVETRLAQAKETNYKF